MPFQFLLFWTKTSFAPAGSLSLPFFSNTFVVPATVRATSTTHYEEPRGGNVSPTTLG